MRRRDERGTSLIVVLFLIGFLGILVPALLGLTLTGARTTSSVIEDRQETYVAISGLEVAVQHGRTARWVGRYGLACPTMNLTIDGHSTSITCVSATGPFELDRTLTYEAEVEGAARARAEVIFRDGTAGAGEPAVDVVTWDTISFD